MSERRTTRRIVFARPFALGSPAEALPAGAYEVDTTEAEIEGIGHTAHVRTSTVLIIPTASGTRHKEVSGKELDAALAEDARQQEQSGLSENPDRGDAG